MKVLIVIDKLWMGGVTTSLINLIKFFPKEVSISLLVFGLRDADKELIPERVELLNSSPLLKVLGFNQSGLLRSNIILASVRSILVLIARWFSGRLARRILFLFIPKVKNFDLAISYTHDVSWNSLTTGCNDFVLYNVDAKRKAAFVHCDYKNYGGYTIKSERLYKELDTIICVSKSCVNTFISCFPMLREKTIAIENFTDINGVIENSHNIIPYRNAAYKIVTTCRVEKQKGIFRALMAFEKLKKEGYKNFTWRIIGDGPDYNLFLDKIKCCNLSAEVEMVGKQIPPYSHMKGASVFLLPSMHEAAPMVFGECHVLGIPIISTNTTSAVELVQDRGLGYVCENSTEGLYNILKDLLSGNLCLDIDMNNLDSVNRNAITMLNNYLNSYTI